MDCTNYIAVEHTHLMSFIVRTMHTAALVTRKQTVDAAELPKLQRARCKQAIQWQGERIHDRSTL